ncbi:MAG TPA: C25 family cysteine peptidase [Planctomycetota bacterium]|nr:C25 family cysteine peptidase [Planctomycetota bacterium]HRR82160.1 C25 family cysteine peptidase [Planctomycetota bacterium]HRT96281.1 C25 family cysteine peptidase [Planctomycetota bacterium]
MLQPSRLLPGRGRRGAFLRAVAGIFGVLVGCAPFAQGSSRAPRPADRAFFAVHLAHVPSWRDFAFLAAVPAATVRCNGAPALIALDESGAITREMDDYLLRYKPQALYCLGPLPREAEGIRRRWQALAADSADSAAAVLARTFWKSADTVAICREGDYGMALVASALAARLRSPLLFTHPENASAATVGLLKELAVHRAVVVGTAPKAASALKDKGLAVVELKDTAAVLAWMREQKMPSPYLAIANPLDREATVVKKLSLAAPLLAAARQGVVAPLPYRTMWKQPFVGAECKAGAPKGAPESRKPPRMGVTTVNGHAFAFVVTSGKNEKDYFAVNVDLNSNGDFSDAGEGPFRTGDVVTLGGQRYSVTLGESNGAGRADVRLTFPCADQIVADLKALYAAAGGPPEHLCLVGFPDAIPHAIVREGEGGSNRDLPSDFPFANADGDLFGEVAVGRLIAESASFATLYASRVITYPHLLDPAWAAMAGQARWENTYAKLFENVGFTMAPHHDVDTLRWLEVPTEKSKGKRAQAFEQDSPLTRVAVLAHQAHSWWHDLGQTYDWESDVLLAPTLVESGGCLTTALDRQPDFRSVVARLLRNGAVGFEGNALPAIAYDEQQRIVFWNAILEGATLGRAHLRAQNSAVAVVLETDQLAGGPNYYQLYIRGLFGDPAFALRVPSPPKAAPARVEAKGDLVSVYAPAQWWPVKIRVPEDWKKWNGKDLYVLRGAGTFPNRHWIGEGYDAEETYVEATLRTARKVRSIEQVQNPPKPLGWSGRYVADEHADGTRTYHWRVRLVDFDQPKGTILHQVERLDYRITFED